MYDRARKMAWYLGKPYLSTALKAGVYSGIWIAGPFTVLGYLGITGTVALLGVTHSGLVEYGIGKGVNRLIDSTLMSNTDEDIEMDEMVNKDNTNNDAANNMADDSYNDSYDSYSSYDEGYDDTIDDSHDEGDNEEKSDDGWGGLNIEESYYATTCVKDQQ